ncbi:hypothetical protein RCH16_001083 [Cryobacterium sp. MP_M5]|nr:MULTISPECIES: hypothetical protein [unclassified Cryobacterium]MBG6057885.1 hypothetical protein [Cryobacterium sp. MP_M3]MEC5176084.1 hypothetical protein [Cryobacterium sp. MP_M5]
MVSSLDLPGDRHPAPAEFLIATGLSIGLAGAVISRPHLLEDDLRATR